jgi:RNA polymerase sigma factor for flagellar operon FliA
MSAVAESIKLTDAIELTGRVTLCGPFRGVETPSVEILPKNERDHLILKHLPQVRLIARRIHDRLPENVSLDDLVSTGVLGLISAIDRFDLSRGVQLSTYAEHKIKGAILDSLRRLDWAPRQDRRHAKQIDAAIAVTEQRLQRSPTEEEIATELSLTVDRYHRWQVKVHGLNLGRLEWGASGDSENHDLLNWIASDQREWPTALLERRELKRALADAISGIPAIEKRILSLYYHDEMTLRNIAKIIGLHESRISQIKAQAILRLRACMTKLWPAAQYRRPRTYART